VPSVGQALTAVSEGRPRPFVFADDPVLRQLCYNPVAELQALRAQPPLLNFSDDSGLTLALGTQHSLGNWSGSVGNSSECARGGPPPPPPPTQPCWGGRVGKRSELAWGPPPPPKRHSQLV
jgi:hypothetical protein